MRKQCILCEFCSFLMYCKSFFSECWKFSGSNTLSHKPLIDFALKISKLYSSKQQSYVHKMNLSICVFLVGYTASVYRTNQLTKFQVTSYSSLRWNDFISLCLFGKVKINLMMRKGRTSNLSLFLLEATKSLYDDFTCNEKKRFEGSWMYHQRH